MTFIYRVLKRLPQLWTHRREVWWAIRDTGSARVDNRGVVYIPMTFIERRAVVMLLRNTCAVQQRACNMDWHQAALAFARRIEVADVATRGEVVKAEARQERPALGI